MSPLKARLRHRLARIMCSIWLSGLLATVAAAQPGNMVAPIDGSEEALVELTTAQADIDFTVSASNYSTPSSIRDATVSGYWTGTIHVHELEIYQIWGGLTMYDEADGQTQNPSWHGGITCGDEDGHWDNDPNSPLDTKLYDVAGGGNPGLFAGQSTASLSLMIRPKDHATWSGGAVEPQAVRIHAAWTAEGTAFEAQTTISQLPVTVYPQTTSAIDAEVDLYPDDEWNCTWDWKYDIPYGSAHEHTVAWSGDPTTASWLATSYDDPTVGSTQVTPPRIAEVYEALKGADTGTGVAAGSATWAREATGFDPTRSWVHDGGGRPVADVFCAFCCEPAGVDCISLAFLGALGCGLAGEPLQEISQAFPQHTDHWTYNGSTDHWKQQISCFAGESDVFFSDHSSEPLQFWAGFPNQFEGYFKAADAYWTCEPPPDGSTQPTTGWQSLPSMVTSIAYGPNGGDEGWVCVRLYWHDHNQNGIQDPGEVLPHAHYHGEVVTDGGVEHTHAVEEPSP
ncbi:MAG: hypothetical protein GF320_04940 [Armatimonadia bacterium]|nr:hypothetical protein [Armatimonadia bacterium]